MPRNHSEKRPLPHLPESVHRYYAEEAKWKSQAVHYSLRDRGPMDRAYEAARAEGHGAVFPNLKGSEAEALRTFYKMILGAGARRAAQ